MKSIKFLIMILALAGNFFFSIAQTNNPMGKTWVIFIENSNYQHFASLNGPPADVNLMKSALGNYQIDNILHKKDLTKAQMERFFSTELKEHVVKNNVNAIMVWYAGHGRFINDIGYWIPTDARRDDELSYYNINNLRTALKAYSDMAHTLIVTDACESGPTFYQAMRSIPRDRSCDDFNATRFRSSQVLSSSGYEYASDNSQFTQTFAQSLMNNQQSCIPIERIVTQVTVSAARSGGQRPKFGKIAGLEDEGGTFFFIAK